MTFILVAVTMIAFLVMYRDRPGRKARYTHGSTPLEIAWTVVPALILVVLTVLSVPAWSKIKMSVPPTDFDVTVMAKQFNWQVTYPGSEKVFLDEMHVPVNKPIRVHLKSQDVIHSFFVPNFRIKQDAVPGREIIAWFDANKAGKYEWPCAELCGFGHSGMKGWIYVHSAADYEKWKAENLVAGAPAEQKADEKVTPAKSEPKTKGKGKS
ncbi:MAG: cytochrome c oxidase subunit II [Candidatus Rokubacteria bacterium]|nr:cytochrome c oxidase subunit II [Candidatus Rokubacteria bacterium]